MEYTQLNDPFKYDRNVNEIFSSKFTVTKNDKNGTYTIKNGSDLCLEFEFKQTQGNETVLFVSKIHKCGGDERSGNALVKLIDGLAESIPEVKYIELEDGSYIKICSDKRWGDIEVSLAHLKILTSGLSWYNSFGYKSLTHDDDVLHNARIINSPMKNLLPEIYEDSLEEFNEKANLLFPELTTDMTIKDYITGMLKTLPTDKTVSVHTDTEINKVGLLTELVQELGYALQYNGQLKKMVQRSAGGNKRKRSKSAKRNIKKRTITRKRSRVARRSSKVH